MDDATDRRAIEAAVIARLPPPIVPWTATASRSPHNAGWTVLLEHEASHGLGLETNEEDASTAIEVIEQLLDSHRAELDRIAAAPVLVDAEMVLEIRTLAHVFNWSQHEVRAVVRMLERRMLTAHEAEWLIEWVGHHGPAPEPSQDF